MKLIDFFGPKSPPVCDSLIGEVRSPPLMDSSSSCVSYLHDLEKNHEEGAGDVSSAVVVLVAPDLFPLTPDPKGFLGTREVGDPEIVPAQPERKSMASLHDVEIPTVEKKAKYNRAHKAKKEASGCDTEEERPNGVSTELVLLFDPYKIKKLTQSDVSHLSRLLIGQDFATRHLLRWMSEETVRQVKSSKGANVIVRDADTCSEHRLVFVSRKSSGYYVLKGGWIKEFVKRRGLAASDEVGIYWDPSTSKFHFSLLHKANWTSS